MGGQLVVGPRGAQRVLRLAWMFLCLAVLALLAAPRAEALPAFARQTGLECTSCHVSWPELTAVGRQFKLGGYTLTKPTSGDRPLVSFDPDTNPPLIPLAAFVQLSATRTRNVDKDPQDFPHQNDVVLQQASLFYAGKIVDHVGAFAQWTYDGIAHAPTIDNVDLRAANRYQSDAFDAIYGISLNNNPTVSDIYQTGPAWGFPFASSSVAAAPAVAPLLGGLGQQVAGLTGYGLFNKTLYAEAGAYRTADGALSLFRAGTDHTADAVLQGAAPYWRLALQHDWNDGADSAMVGTTGLSAKKFPDSLQAFGPTDRFRDTTLDLQYQHVTDVHRIGATASFIRETQHLDATFGAGGSSNPIDRLRGYNGRVTYYYQARYGVSVGRFALRGDADPLAYANNAGGSPESAGYVVELDWLPWRDRRFVLQYTQYQKFDGGSINYNGAGRNARDNDTLYLLAWFAF